MYKNSIKRTPIENKKIKSFIKNQFCLLTLHRPENVDSFKNLQKIIKRIKSLSKKIRILFTVHPRTKKLKKL